LTFFSWPVKTPPVAILSDRTVQYQSAVETGYFPGMFRGDEVLTDEARLSTALEAQKGRFDRGVKIGTNHHSRLGVRKDISQSWCRQIMTKSCDCFLIQRLCVGVCGVAVLTLFAGCRGGSMESEVSGTVTLDGKKVGPGTIVFAPTNPKGTPATGSVESDGGYTMKTSRERGLSAGTYRVAVSIREMPQNVKRGDRPPPGKSLIPEKYEDQSTSGLEFKVEPGRNTINVELLSR
jgi:hypothetical protein